MTRHALSRRETSSLNLRGASIRRDVPIVGAKTTVVGSAIADREVAESFATAVSGFDAAQLAQAANRSKEIARQWKQGAKAPNAASLINMARKIPAVEQWLRFEIGRREEMEFSEAQINAIAQRILQQSRISKGGQDENIRLE